MAAYFRKLEAGKQKWVEWHIGEPIPDFVAKQSVVTMQADGDELQALYYGLEKYRK